IESPQRKSPQRRLIMANERRDFLAAAGALGVAVLTPSPSLFAADEKDKKNDKDKKGKEEEEVSAPEDLMREHGVLNRILLIYEQGLKRLHATEEVPPEVLSKTANLVRKFVEDYHEKHEENSIFSEIEERH